jgi:Ca2+-transporting ATPase
VAGIKAVMITGDHPLTAQAVARELGLLTNGRVVTGAALDEMDPPS